MTDLRHLGRCRNRPVLKQVRWNTPQDLLGPRHPILVQVCAGKLPHPRKKTPVGAATDQEVPESRLMHHGHRNRVDRDRTSRAAVRSERDCATAKSQTIAP